MAVRNMKNKLDFIEKNFEIHGEFEGQVYRTKRNGVQEKYVCTHQSYYRRTALVMRNEAIRKAAATVTNPNEENYSEIIRKFNYYTPYILHVGSQQFLGQTVFYIRERGEYEFRISGSPVSMVQVAGKRSKIAFNFGSEGEYIIECLQGGEVYCRRSVIITAEDLDAAYAQWLAGHLEEIIGKTQVKYEKIKQYRRGLRSKRNWILAVSGKVYDEVVYTLPQVENKEHKRQYPLIYHRKAYNHKGNKQTKKFNELMPLAAQQWWGLSKEERVLWNKRAGQQKRRLSGFNLYIANFEWKRKR